MMSLEYMTPACRPLPPEEQPRKSFMTGPLGAPLFWNFHERNVLSRAFIGLLINYSSILFPLTQRKQNEPLKVWKVLCKPWKKEVTEVWNHISVPEQCIWSYSIFPNWCHNPFCDITIRCHGKIYEIL